MKVQIIILAFLLAFLENSVNKNIQNSNAISNISISKAKEKSIQNNHFTIGLTDTIKKPVPYKVLNKNPTLSYTIRKIGNGDKVLFYIGNGSRKLPELTFSASSGVHYEIGRKKGLESVSFPFKCSINASANYMVNNFSNKGSLLNDFEIEINEPGNWEISFNAF